MIRYHRHHCSPPVTCISSTLIGCTLDSKSLKLAPHSRQDSEQFPNLRYDQNGTFRHHFTYYQPFRHRAPHVWGSTSVGASRRAHRGCHAAGDQHNKSRAWLACSTERRALNRVRARQAWAQKCIAAAARGRAKRCAGSALARFRLRVFSLTRRRRLRGNTLFACERAALSGGAASGVGRRRCPGR
jgi:hypothetical protein